MKYILGILAVILAVGIFTATQAEAYDPCSGFTLQVEGRGHTLKAPQSPTVTVEGGLCVLEWERRMFVGINEARFYENGELFLVEEDVPRPNQGYDYTFKLTLGPVIEVEINAERYLVWGGLKFGYHYLHSAYEHPYLHWECIDAGGIGEECVARTIVKD